MVNAITHFLPLNRGSPGGEGVDKTNGTKGRCSEGVGKTANP